ncbi:TPA: hypothetical protein ACH3X2_011889 [Trebouxia sp. C0005]
MASTAYTVTDAHAKVHVIDLSLPDEEAQAAILHACVTTGFFYVSNHNVLEEVIEEHWLQNKAFFNLPLEDKLTIVADSNNRGYTPMAEQTLDPDHQSQGDTKEGLYFGREVPADSEEAKLPLHGPNQWPPEALLPGYKAAMNTYMDAVRNLADRLLPLIAMALRLPSNFFDLYFHKPIGTLRPLHYNAQMSLPDEGIYGAGAHTDWGVLTILATDENPGLQVFSGGKWAHVKPVPGTFIINLGDMLERCCCCHLHMWGRAVPGLHALCACNCFQPLCSLHLSMLVACLPSVSGDAFMAFGNKMSTSLLMVFRGAAYCICLSITLKCYSQVCTHPP